jgi:hypothetical protein
MYHPSFLLSQVATTAESECRHWKSGMTSVVMFKNSDDFAMLHLLFGFYNRDGECLLRGAN